jgi:hypothetical protein
MDSATDDHEIAAACVNCGKEDIDDTKKLKA